MGARFVVQSGKGIHYMPLTPQEFVSKWKRVTACEKQTYQEHFIDLCHLVGHQTPNDYDFCVIATRFNTAEIKKPNQEVITA